MFSSTPSRAQQRLDRAAFIHALIAYLRGGHVFEVYRGWSWCRFRCGAANEAMGHADLTDGSWIWPEGLVHHVETHELALPDEFVDCARSRQGVVPPVTPAIVDGSPKARAVGAQVVGRKNHYGSKSKRGTEVASLFYSLLETAKLHDVDPARYLREAVRAADRGEMLLPSQLAVAPS